MAYKREITTHLDLEGTGGPGDGRLSGSCFLGPDRPGTATALQTPGRRGGGHDDGGDRKGEANDGQSELHVSILGGTEETMDEGVTVCISLRRNGISLSAMRSRRLCVYVCGRHRYCRRWVERVESSGEEE